MKRKLWSMGAALFAACLAQAPAALADPIYVEVVDAGSLLPGAQNVGGGVNTINGNLTSNTDVDVYALDLAGGFFSARTNGPACCSGTDTQLFLFDVNGLGVAANDDGLGLNSQSSLIETTLAAGRYYLAVSTWDYDPYSTGGFIFPDYQLCCNHVTDKATGPGGSSSLLGWAVGPLGAGSGTQPGAYSVTLNQVTVPEPGTLALFGAGLVMVSVAMRRRQIRGKAL
jgi:hypothetical protein